MMYPGGFTTDFASSLTMPFCGPNLGFEPTQWLPAPPPPTEEGAEPTVQSAQSVALLPLPCLAIERWARAIKTSFGRAECLRNPDDPRKVAVYVKIANTVGDGYFANCVEAP